MPAGAWAVEELLGGVVAAISSLDSVNSLFERIPSVPQNKRHSNPPSHQPKTTKLKSDAPKDDPKPAAAQHVNRAEQTAVADAHSVDRRLWGMTKFEWIMAALTLIGLFVAIVSGRIYVEQLQETRIDQRPWITLMGNEAVFRNDGSGGATFVMPITIGNTGKTPARNLHSEIVVEKIYNGNGPKFIYENIPRVFDTTGIIGPNEHVSTEAQLLDPGPTPKRSVPRHLSPAEFQDLKDGGTYLAIYAYTTYDDVFGIHHWNQFCTVATRSQTGVDLTAKSCTDYNNFDTNWANGFLRFLR